MARTLNREVHALRREVFVDAAQRLITAKGYDQMSIQDVLDELEASRGALYHYFDSKVALLEAVVERMVEAALAEVAPVVDDPGLPAAGKMSALFEGIGAWKTDRKDLILALLEVWYSDDNAIVREKVRQATLQRMTPLLAAIIRQGNAEGAFTVASPEHTARVLVALLTGSQDWAGELFLASLAGKVSFEEVMTGFGALTEAYERILGVQPGSLQMVDRTMLHAWFDNGNARKEDPA